MLLQPICHLEGSRGEETAPHTHPLPEGHLLVCVCVCVCLFKNPPKH